MTEFLGAMILVGLIAVLAVVFTAAVLTFLNIDDDQ